MLNDEELAYLELTEVAELIRTRQITSVETTEAILRRTEALEPTLKSFASVQAEQALEAARQADREIAHGRYRGALHGVPIAVKDLAYTTDAPTASGGTLTSGYIAPYDATVVSRLRAAGAVITGKLAMTEGAWAEHHPDVPAPVNPWDAEIWTGVSSSGSGVATAAGLCYASLGSDTGGSIRLPSSLNGVTGVKPTWGRVSRYGITELAASLDHIGPMTRSARDAAVVLTAIAGADKNDPTSSLEPVPNYLADIDLVSRPAVGIDWNLMERFDEPTRDLMHSVVQVLRGLDWAVVEVNAPDLASAAADFEPLCSVETAVAHADTYPARAREYGPTLAQHIDHGRAMSAMQYQVLMQRRRDFTGQMHRLLRGIDLFLLPGIGMSAPTLETIRTVGDTPELLATILIPCAPINLCGLPSITLPGGFSDRGTPLAFQLVGRPFEEQLLLQAANAYQLETSFHRVHPDVRGQAKAAV
ncbi:amidase (plasmid) [Arthrobacter sp. FW305-123]|nr:amidase [Arthrobacter sp. FW305-123]